MPFTEGTDDSTGLLGHFIGTVLDAQWATNPEAKSEEARNKVYNYWTVRVDDIIQEDFSGADQDEVTVRWGIGSGWETEDGQTITHESDNEKKRKKIGSQSPYGKFINLVIGKADTWAQAGHSVTVTDGDGDIDEVDFSGAMKHLDSTKKTDRDADLCVGTQWEFRGVTITYGPNRDAPGTTMQGRQPVPVRYLGTQSVEDDSAGQSSGGGDEQGEGEKTETRPTPQEQAPEEISERELQDGEESGSVVFSEDEGLNTSLNNLLATATTYTEFRAKAVAMPEVAKDEGVLALVLNKSKVWVGR